MRYCVLMNRKSRRSQLQFSISSDITGGAVHARTFLPVIWGTLEDLAANLLCSELGSCCNASMVIPHHDTRPSLLTSTACKQALLGMISLSSDCQRLLRSLSGFVPMCMRRQGPSIIISTMHQSKQLTFTSGQVSVNLLIRSCTSVVCRFCTHEHSFRDNVQLMR